MAKSLNFLKGSVVAMDRGYIDYRQFARGSAAAQLFQVCEMGSGLASMDD